MASSIPGRFRLRNAVLKNETVGAEFARRIAEDCVAAECRINARCGSATVTYDPQSVRREEIEAVALGALGDGPTANAKACATSRANEIGKKGAIMTLAITLGSLAFGWKKAHAIAGAAFVGFLGMHMFAHRKALVPRAKEAQR